jgi:tRNA A-37 threonylcarbamoyl transferase component Bud32
MTDREKDHSQDSSKAERLAHAEPGIKLKVSDAEDEHAISSAVSSITEPLNAVARVSVADIINKEREDEDEQLLSLLDEGIEPKVDPLEEKYKTLKRLPSLIPAAVMLFVGLNEPWAFIFFSYFYWVFCSYRTSLTVKNLFSDANLAPKRVLIMAMLPVLIVLSTILFSLSVRVFSLPYSLFFWYPWTLVGTVIAYTIYQWKWPISASIALRRAELIHGSESKDPAFLVHGVTGLLFNLVPLFLIAYGMAVGLMPSIRDNPVTAPLFALGFGIMQYGSFFFFKKRITDAALQDRDFRIYFERAKKKPPKVSDDDIVVRYRAFAEWERWFKHRFKEKSNKKLLFLLTTVLLFFMVGAPNWCLTALTQMPGVAVAGIEGGAQAANNINFLNMFQSLLIGIFLAAGIIYVSKPTHVGFSKKGIRFLWRHAILEVNGSYVPWSAFNKIRLLLPKGKTSPTDQRLMFDAGQTSGVDRNVEIKLASVIQVDDKERILKAIERFAPGVERDAMVLQVLQPPADHSYTELWLQALAAPPKRERFKPLADGASLLDRRFQVLGQLGVGGQGTAYLATDTHEKSHVVLKEFILPVYVDVTVRRQALERFENEARILKHLDHDQIVKLIDFFVEDHRSYLVLEHIEGKSLKQIVDEQGPLSEKQVIELAKQMCTMLEYLHGLEPPVVHRDFTPDNLILRNDGKLKLVDFNVAQQTDSTATGTVVGKHAYLPPEQFRGTPVPQSDLYSLGATLHYLLTGQDPEPISVSHPQRLKKAVSDNMDLFVSRATAMTLELRHQNVQELAQEISDFFDRT